MSIHEVGQLEELFRNRREVLGQRGRHVMQQVCSLQNQVSYQHRKRRAAEQPLQPTLPRKQHFRIVAVWYIRAALTRHNVPVAALAELLSDIPIDEQVHKPRMLLFHDP